jgi:hypothetical protein
VTESGVLVREKRVALSVSSDCSANALSRCLGGNSTLLLGDSSIHCLQFALRIDGQYRLQRKIDQQEKNSE